MDDAVSMARWCKQKKEIVIQYIMCSESRPIGWEWSEWCGLHMRVKKNTPSGDGMSASNAMISCTPVRIGTISCVGFTLQMPLNLRSCDTVVWFTCCFLDCGGSMQSMVRFRRNVPSQYVSVKYIPCCTAPNNGCPFCVTPDANLFPMSSWLNHVYFNYNIKYYVKMATTSLLGIKHMLVNDSHVGCNCPLWNLTHPDNLACFWGHWPLGRQSLTVVFGIDPSQSNLHTAQWKWDTGLVQIVNSNLASSYAISHCDLRGDGLYGTHKKNGGKRLGQNQFTFRMNSRGTSP